MAEKKIKSFILSIYTLFEPQNIIWTPVYKKKMGKGSHHISAFIYS